MVIWRPRPNKDYLPLLLALLQSAGSLRLLKLVPMKPGDNDIWSQGFKPPLPNPAWAYSGAIHDEAQQSIPGTSTIDVHALYV